MMRRFFTGLLAFVGCWMALSVAAAAPPAKPNIVILLADDLGWGDPVCYQAESKMVTPHIDHLAKQGLRFTDSHTNSSVCTPTRYGLLTGRYAWRTSLKTGVLGGYSPLLIESGRLTVASLLKSQGYSTAGIGKWHLGLGSEKKTDFDKPLKPGPNDCGFDYYFGIPASLDMPPYVFIENDHPTEPPSAMIDGSKMRREGGGGFWRAGAIGPTFKHENVLPTLTDKAVEFIGQQSAAKPFFLYVPFNSPHTPWMPIKDFQGKSKVGWYGDFVQQTDDCVGRILAALDKAKLSDNTLVIFTSDNGAHWLASDIEQFGHRANAQWRGQKADIWEAGHRVPFIVRWPGHVPSDKTSDVTICHTDILATVAEIVGVKLPHDAGEDSFSFVSALAGTQPSQPTRPAIVHHSISGQFGIRQGEWKLCLGLGSGGFTAPKKVEPKANDPHGQLYNLKDDPGETNNRWLQETAMVERLTKLLELYQKSGRSRE